MIAERVGKQAGFDRDLFVLDLAASEPFPARLGVTSARFVCLLAWDATSASVDTVRLVARRLLDNGAVWIACWGPDCERVHDAVDEEFGRWPNREPEGVVMTTWHSSEPLGEVITFSLLGLIPDEHYSKGCSSLIGIAIGEPAWGRDMRAAYSNPAAHLARALQHEESDGAV